MQISLGVILRQLEKLNNVGIFEDIHCFRMRVS